MKAMIFAAGMGTRLKPMTDIMPKALVPVGGKPLLEHVARKLMNSGIGHIVVNVHHFADMIKGWISAQDWMCTGEGDYGEGRLRVSISDESKMLLETGGAVLKAEDYLKGCGYFLIHNVDVFSNCDLKWFMEQIRQDALAMLLVSRRETSRYFLFHPGSMRLVGWKNVKTGDLIMTDPSLKDEECLTYAFSGMHILSDTIFEYMSEYVRGKGLESEDGARFSIVDFYLWAASAHPIYGVVQDDLQMLDVGKTDSLEKAEEMILNL